MLIKLIVILLFGLILYSLGKALFFLRDGQKSLQTAKALTWRISLSLCVFAFLLLAFLLGWIKPHNFASTMPSAQKLEKKTSK
jgi:hypothetical protein